LRVEAAVTATVRQTSLFGEPAKARRDTNALRAPFPYFGGKSGVASLIWYAFGDVKQYIEPFCGSAAVLLAAPQPAALEVANDVNRYLANFWRAVKHQPEAVWSTADYPVSHIDLAARHRWLVDPGRTQALDIALADPEWPGDAQIAGWWCWGQCAWIGSGWCEDGKVPHASNAGRGLQAHGQVPHAGNAGMGLQAHGLTDRSRTPATPEHGGLAWLRCLSKRLSRVRLYHGDWTRCLNHHYGGKRTGIFFDPPYVAYERLYGKQEPVALDVARWCAEHGELRLALCGHAGDYDQILDGWQVLPWDRGRLTYGGGKTTASEAIWFSPACRRVIP
jgi:hypothetical protein